MLLFVVASAGGVGTVTEAVVNNPGPELAGESACADSLTATLIGPKSFLADSALRNRKR